MSAKVIYIIDEDRVNRDLIERLIKNEYGQIVIKRFDSCEAGYKYFLGEQRFTIKEYPDTILLSGNLSSHCITRFLSEIETFQPQIDKCTEVFMMLDPGMLQKAAFADHILVKGYIERPIRPKALLNMVQSLLATG